MIIMNKKRLDYLDYVKAVCIFWILMEHRILRPEGVGAGIMPSFFILAGYTYSTEIAVFKDYAIKRVKRLLVPYWIMMLVCAVIEVIRAPLLGYAGRNVIIPALIPAFYGSSRNFPCIGEFGQYVFNIMSYKPQAPGLIDMILPINCFLWFLPAMFSANIIFYLVSKYRKNTWCYDYLAICGLLALASIETIPGIMQLPYGLGRGFIGAAFMMLGYKLRETNYLADNHLSKQLLGLVIAVPISVLSVIYKYDCFGFVRSDYGPHMIINVFISFICGAAFSYVLIIICRLISKASVKPIHNFLSLAGSNSMGIYLWHMLIFFLGDLFMIFVMKEALAPDDFFMECFVTKCVGYRWLIVIFTYTLLTIVGYIRKRNNIKSRFGLF